MARRIQPSFRFGGLSFRVCALGILAGSIALLIVLFVPVAPSDFSVDAIEKSIRASGAWGVLISIGLMVLHSFVPFPAEFLALANGMVYGALWGTAITWTGAMLGAMVAFCLSRALGRPFVQLLVSKRNWHTIDDWTAKDGWKLALVSRFVPVIAFNLINYAAGLTRISWWTFVWTTAVGILPLTTLMVVMGDQIDRIPVAWWLVLFAVGLGMWFVLRRALHAWRTEAE